MSEPSWETSQFDDEVRSARGKSVRRAPGARRALWPAVLLFLYVVLAVAAPALAVVPEVQDGAGFFKPETIAKVNDAVAEIGKKHHKDLLIETYATVPADKVEAVKAMDKEARTKFFQEWARSRGIKRQVNGVYVLITKEPGHIQVEVGDRTERAAFTAKDRDHLRDILTEAFKKKEYDSGIVDAAQFVAKTLDENMTGARARRVR
jgi:uncharacterized membrane protein YgcG